jgi:septum formation protein
MPPPPSPTRLILASASPQRRQILANAGYRFESVDPGDVEDTIDAAPTPEALAIAKARVKAREVARKLAPPFPAVVLGVDTLVAFGAEVIGKPLDRFDAAAILSRLSGTRHQVISGVCLWPVPVMRTPGAAEKMPEPQVASAVSWVQMRRLSAQEIEQYVASGESDGKAGAYAVQESGDRFVEKIDGSFLNVVGFPLELFTEWLPQTLRDWGLENV